MSQSKMRATWSRTGQKKGGEKRVAEELGVMSWGRREELGVMSWGEERSDGKRT